MLCVVCCMSRKDVIESQPAVTEVEYLINYKSHRNAYGINIDEPAR